MGFLTQQINKQVGKILTIVTDIQKKASTIMATLDDIKAKTDTLTQALADLDTREASETTLNQGTLDAVGAALDTAITHVQGVDQTTAPAPAPAAPTATDANGNPVAPDQPAAQ